MSELTTLKQDEKELINVLKNSLYPGAKDESIKLVLGYCKAAGLDPMQKPVHIVPMYDSNSKSMKDVIMPGVGLYRTQASRSSQYAGMSEPEFGPDVTETLGGVSITYPKWCKVTIKRVMPNGNIAEFTAIEFWKENYAQKGGQEKSIAPNAMWFKRPYGQISKCVEAQALRKGFPEFGAQPTAEEMEGKFIDDSVIYSNIKQTPQAEGVSLEYEQKWLSFLEESAEVSLEKLNEAFKSIPKSNDKTLLWEKYGETLKKIAKEAEFKIIDSVQHD